jgi:lipopolysaccharide transport system ATP-binding protein
MDSSAGEVVEEYFKLKVQSEQIIIPTAVENSEGHLDTNLNAACFTDNSAFLQRAGYQRIRNGKAEFYNIQLLKETGVQAEAIEYGQKVTLRMVITVYEDLEELAFGYHIRSSTGVDVVYSDSILENKSLYQVKKGETYIIDWEFNACLSAGMYNFSCVLSIPLDLTLGKVDFCDFVPCALQMVVSTRSGKALYGFVHWENNVIIEKHEKNQGINASFCAHE